MARPRTPLAIRKLRGNPSGHWERLATGIDVPAEMPTPPDWLCPEAKAIFIETADLLFKLGTVTKYDTASLARYAANSSIVRHNHRALAKSPGFAITADGKFIRHPSIRILREFEALLMKFETESGLTAAARAKINITPPPDRDANSFAKKYLT